MTRLDQLFASLAAKREGAFMPYLVIGDPDLETSFQLACALIDAGADVLELGLPFSDPPADGPLLQAASKRALASGMRTERAFEYLERIKKRSNTPIALLLYYNLVLQMGVDRFYARAKAAGVEAILIADLPIEEADAALASARAHDIAPIFIVSEVTAAARIDRILERASGYLYVVARIGVTGVRESVDHQLDAVLAMLRRKTALPLLAGFGLSTPAHVASVIESGANGAIVGSAIARAIEANLGDTGKMIAVVAELGRELKRATRKGR